MSRHCSRRRVFETSIPLIVLVLAITSCASRSYTPPAPDAMDFLGRARTQEASGVRVTAAVPNAEESEAIFGLPVYEKRIQPVWLEIQNGTERRIRFAPVGTDPVYFSPHEVAYMHKGHYAGQGYRDMERALYEQSMNRWIWPGETRSGFVFTHLEPGTKAFNVDIFSARDDDRSFTFFIDVPGMRPDHADIDFAALYAPVELRRYDLDGFRAALGELRCCATNHTGEMPGRPINVVMVGGGNDVLQALLRAGWFERQRAEKREQVEKEQHWDGRPPDAVFRIRRARKGDRDELRVWLAPILVDGEQVWLGQISHYIGQLTELGRALFDPRLDPDVDDSRDYMLQLIWYSQGLEQHAWQHTEESVPVGDPRTDFTGVRYFTGGERVVLWLSGPPVSQIETKRIDWDPFPGGCRGELEEAGLAWRRPPPGAGVRGVLQAEAARSGGLSGSDAESGEGRSSRHGRRTECGGDA